MFYLGVGLVLKKKKWKIPTVQCANRNISDTRNRQIDRFPSDFTAQMRSGHVANK